MSQRNTGKMFEKTRKKKLNKNKNRFVRYCLLCAITFKNE